MRLAKTYAKRSRDVRSNEKKYLETMAARAERAKLQDKPDKNLQKTWNEIVRDTAHEKAFHLRAMGCLPATAAKLRRRALAACAGVRPRRSLPMDCGELFLLRRPRLPSSD